MIKKFLIISLTPVLVCVLAIAQESMADPFLQHAPAPTNEIDIIEGPDCIKQLPQLLQEFFKDCTLIEGLRPAKIRRSLKRGQPIAIPIAGNKFLLDLKLDQTLFSTEAIKRLETEKTTWIRRAVSNTFVGAIQGLPESNAAVTISSNNRFIYGFGFVGPEAEGQFFLETLVEPQRPLRVLTYRGSDVRVKVFFPGDDTDTLPVPLGNNDIGNDIRPLTHTNQLILAHGDLAFVNKFSSIEIVPEPGRFSGAFARMEALIALIRSWYQPPTTDVRFQIAELELATFNFDPTNANELLNTFRDHMEGPSHHPGATYHVAHLFTGVNIVKMTGPIVGIGDLPWFIPERPDLRGHYAISQMVAESGFYDATFFTQGLVLAHELGHNYGATHERCDPGPPPDFMCGEESGGPSDTRRVSVSGFNRSLIHQEEASKPTR